MINIKQPLQNSCTVEQSCTEEYSTIKRVDTVLKSPSVNNLRSVLSRVGSELIPKPILHKYLPGHYLRLMFPVMSDVVAIGKVVSVVVLYDTKKEETLYAHPMYAGPYANPLFKNIHGPMASPKSQEGQNGDQANIRFLEHKKALWERFCLEKMNGNERQASLRWRMSYYWALKQLYFCSQCTSCEWGNPLFESSSGSRCEDDMVFDVSDVAREIPRSLRNTVDVILNSELWEIEAEYVKRGGWSLSNSPLVVQRRGSEFLQLIFPTNARLVQGGSITALLVLFHLASQKTYYVHSLVAGLESDIVLTNSKALSLPLIPETKISDYQKNSEESWRRFRVNELEYGLAFASLSWLSEFWQTMDSLVDGNLISNPSLFFQSALDQTRMDLNPFLQTVLLDDEDLLDQDEINLLPQTLHEGHVLKTFYLEHDCILEVLNTLERINLQLQESIIRRDFTGTAQLKSVSDDLNSTELHHRREEEVLFPMIEERGFRCHPTTIKNEHIELHALKCNLESAIQNESDINFDDFKKEINTISKQLIPTLREHIFKENNIMYPAALKKMDSKGKLAQLKKECDEIGYCHFSSIVDF